MCEAGSVLPQRKAVWTGGGSLQTAVVALLQMQKVELFTPQLM